MRIKKKGFTFGTAILVVVVLLGLVYGGVPWKEYIDTKNQKKPLNQNAGREDKYYSDGKTELEDGTDVWMGHAYHIIDVWKESGRYADMLELTPKELGLTEDVLYRHMGATWPTTEFTIRWRGNFLEDNYNVIFFDVYVRQADGYYKKALNDIVMTLYEDGTFVPFADTYDAEREAATIESLIQKAQEINEKERANGGE